MAYIIVGHGTEHQTEFEDRRRLPPGITLVTLAECGSQTTAREVSRVVEAFGNERMHPVFAEPRRHRMELEELVGAPLHVYTEGMSYPNMTVQLFADWEGEGEADAPSGNKKTPMLRFVKSGVYRFPLDASEWRLSSKTAAEEGEHLFGTLGLTSRYQPKIVDPTRVPERVFAGSVFPTPAEAARALQDTKGSLGAFKKALRVPLDALFARLGPGVYYYVICRTSAESNLAGYVETYIPDRNVPDGFLNAADPIPYIPALLPAMNLLASKRTAEKKANPEAKPRWNDETVLGAPNKYRKLYNTTLRIRRASMSQQDAAKKRRRRSRRTKRSRRTGF